MYSIGLDIGTSSAKGILISKDGKILAVSHQEYALETPSEGICEVEASIYWDKTVLIINELIAISKVNPIQIKGIACSTQGETLICVDKYGNPLRKAIVWLDNRTTKEAKIIEDHFGQDTILAKTGQPEILPLWPATRILWIKEHEPKIFENTHKFLLVEDYINFKLSGKYVSDYSVSSSTLYLDIVEKKWWKEMLDFLKISESQLPDLMPSGTAIGQVNNNNIELNHTTLVAGCYDHAAGAVGAGNISAGIITETTGSSMAMVVTSDVPILDKKLNLPCQIHAIENKYFLLPYGQTAGMAFKWFAREFAQFQALEAKKNKKDIYDILTLMASKIAPGSDGLIMLPHLAGAGSPEFDTNARGAFVGITLSMGKGHFVRALLESVACMVQRNIHSLRDKGINPKEIRALGGGAKSDLWNQIKADMLEIPLLSLEVQETPALGVAILAAVGTGLFDNIEQGCAIMVKPLKTYIPNEDNKPVYKKLYNNYCKLTNSLEGFYD